MRILQHGKLSAGMCRWSLGHPRPSLQVLPTCFLPHHIGEHTTLMFTGDLDPRSESATLASSLLDSTVADVDAVLELLFSNTSLKCATASLILLPSPPTMGTLPCDARRALVSSTREDY